MHIEDTEPQSIKVAHGRAADSSSYVPTRAGYRFAHWSTQPQQGTQLGAKFEQSVNADGVVLHAQWVKQWQVTFQVADGEGAFISGASQETRIVDANSTVGALVQRMPSPVREGYIVDGWKLPDGRVFSVDQFKQTPITQDMTVTAHWVAGQRWTVRFDLNGGGAPDGKAKLYEPQGVDNGQFAHVPALADDDKPLRSSQTGSACTFQGWTTVPNDALGLSVFQFNKRRIDRDITLYALWSCPVGE